MQLEENMTQLDAARKGIVTNAMRAVAEAECRDVEFIRIGIAEGRIVVPSNILHKSLRPMGIGRELKTKINANIGTSPTSSCIEMELTKLDSAVKYGADTVMDLSTGEHLEETRRTIIAHSQVPIGTVPIYELVWRSGLNDDADIDFSREAVLSVIREQAEQGVDYMTMHCGIRPSMLSAARARKLRIVSRGGSLITRYMSKTGRDNPYYEYYDDILEICHKYDVTISLGDGLRPGCLADASDSAQFAELAQLGELAERAKAAGVQVMIEGPGHIPLDEVEMNMKLERRLCHDAPFYVLGPVTMDCAPGYDHITSAIGAAVGAWHGAAMLCYVTPKEHLGLPNANDVHEGVVAYKIAAHVADIAKHIPHAMDQDNAISDARAAFDWKLQMHLALDPERATALREEAIKERNSGKSAHGDEHFCSMCGAKFCSLRVSREI